MEFTVRNTNFIDFFFITSDKKVGIDSYFRSGLRMDNFKARRENSTQNLLSLPLNVITEEKEEAGEATDSKVSISPIISFLHLFNLYFTVRANLTNTLRAAFAPDFLHTKTVSTEKLQKLLLYFKNAHKM